MGEKEGAPICINTPSLFSLFASRCDKQLATNSFLRILRQRDRELRKDLVAGAVGRQEVRIQTAVAAQVEHALAFAPEGVAALVQHLICQCFFRFCPTVSIQSITGQKRDRPRRNAAAVITSGPGSALEQPPA